MVNIVPNNDERRHVHQTDCWCEPVVHWQDDETGEVFENGPLVVHNAADHREAVEELIGEQLAQDKDWGIFVS